jgi:ectoine hydroxylase-related dioxygenase (phytanoyl-CoA dioxygenase family)
VAFDLQQFADDGFAVTEPLLSSSEVAELIAMVEADVDSQSKRGGVRDVMTRIPSLAGVAMKPSVRAIVEQVLGEDALVVRSTLFDKTPSSNWKVPWHQDVTIAVRERVETKGYGPWSTKESITHVQPPTEVLSRMVTVRIHLDPCHRENGALRVMPGSHHLGRIDQNRATDYVDEQDAVNCEAAPGEALVMRPLLLHASAPSELPTHRRVLHFDFAVGRLDGSLDWHMRELRKSREAKSHFEKA